MSKINVALFITAHISKYADILNFINFLSLDDRFKIDFLYDKKVKGNIEESFIKKDFPENKYNWILADSSLYENNKYDYIFIIDPYYSNRGIQGTDDLKLDKFKSPIVYFEYGVVGFDPDNSDRVAYNRKKVFKSIKYIITSCNYSKELILKYLDFNEDNILIGNPAFDYTSNICYNDSIEKDNKFTILWTPHHSFIHMSKNTENFNCKYSTVLTYYKYILGLFEKELKDCQLYIKPHPSLKYKLEHSGNGDVYRYIKSKSQENDNIELLSNHEDYRKYFLVSDLILNDSISFILSYLPTQKPMILLQDDKCDKRSDLVNELISKCQYLATYDKEILNTIDKLHFNKENSEKLINRKEYLKLFKPDESKLNSELVKDFLLTKLNNL